MEVKARYCVNVILSHSFTIFSLTRLVSSGRYGTFLPSTFSQILRVHIGENGVSQVDCIPTETLFTNHAIVTVTVAMECVA